MCCSPWGHIESDMISRLKNSRAGKDLTLILGANFILFLKCSLSEVLLNAPSFQ